MKSLIILLAVVAHVRADGSADAFQQCLKETIQFKGCVSRQVQNSTMENMKQLRGFGDAITKCFDIDGVKGICILPTPGPHGAAQQHVPMPTPIPGSDPCFQGAQNAFMTCFKKGAGIPDDFKLQGLPEQPQQGGPQHGPGGPPQMHNHFFHLESPEEIESKILEICGGNQAAADKLLACAKEAAKPYIRSLFAVTNPLLSACHAAETCENDQTVAISADCKAKLVQGGKAFCDCRPEGQKFIKESDQCGALRSAMADARAAHAAAVQPAEDAAAAHHDIPHHPDNPFDFCAHPNICGELKEKMEKARVAYAASKPAQ